MTVDGENEIGLNEYNIEVEILKDNF